MPGADGLKTGHTDNGGYGIVASSKVAGRRLIGIINGFHGKGHDALADEMKKLLNYGYKTTQTKTFYRPGDTLVKIPVWYGRYETVDATVQENVSVTLPKDYNMKNIRVLARYEAPISAPVKIGQQIGEIVIENNGDVVKRIPLIAKNKVRKIMFFGRIIKHISVLLGAK
jgi:D-alanyl-D-alanine carboxypeptidase (penicillin-binding protein 5/6)